MSICEFSIKAPKLGILAAVGILAALFVFVSPIHAAKPKQGDEQKGLTKTCRDNLAKINQAARWRYERFVGKLDPLGPMEQLFHPRYKNAAQRKAAALHSLYSVKPIQDSESVYGLTLKMLREPLSNKFFEEDRIREFMSRADRYKPKKGQKAPQDTIITYCRYILMNRHEGLLQSALSNDLGRRGLGHLVVTSADKRILRPAMKWTAGLLFVTVTVNITQPYINTFLIPINSKYLGRVEQAAFKFWGPLLSDKEAAEIQQKADNILDRLDRLAARENILTPEEMEKEFDLALSEWADVFLKFKQRVRPTQGTGRDLKNDAQTWMDSLVDTAKTLEFRLDDIEFLLMDEDKLSQRKREFLEGSKSRTQRELAIVIARIDWAHNTYYLFVNDVNQDGLRYIDEMGRARMIQLVGGIQQVRDVYHEVFTKTIFETLNAGGP